MISGSQRRVIDARESAVASIENGATIPLNARIARAGRQLNIVAKSIRDCLDESAQHYIALGCTSDEWREDMVRWFREQQFFIDDDINDASNLRIHLSVVGWSRHVILTFQFNKPLK